MSLAAMRTWYDARRNPLARDVVTGHGDECYLVLFQRGVDWVEKARLLVAADNKVAKKANKK